MRGAHGAGGRPASSPPTRRSIVPGSMMVSSLRISTWRELVARMTALWFAPKPARKPCAHTRRPGAASTASTEPSSEALSSTTTSSEARRPGSSASEARHASSTPLVDDRDRDVGHRARPRAARAARASSTRSVALRPSSQPSRSAVLLECDLWPGSPGARRELGSAQHERMSPARSSPGSSARRPRRGRGPRLADRATDVGTPVPTLIAGRPRPGLSERERAGHVAHVTKSRACAPSSKMSGARPLTAARRRSRRRRCTGWSGPAGP